MSNKETTSDIDRVFEIFKTTEGDIRPHMILVGPSGSGKSHTVEMLCENHELNWLEINAAQLTKEGTSGNSLSKALTPLLQMSGTPVVCFVDEFDKLFISGNSNSSLAHETTNGVQNEFLKVLESKNASVFGEFGKYLTVPVDNVLFIFAGAFNGEEDISLDRLREFGIKTEFLGRAGLVYSLVKMTIEDLEGILDKSPLLENYLKLFPEVKEKEVKEQIMTVVRDNYEKNTLGVRILTNLIHRYFITGKLTTDTAEKATFQKTLTLK